MKYSKTLYDLLEKDPCNIKDEILNNILSLGIGLNEIDNIPYDDLKAIKVLLNMMITTFAEADY